MSIKRKNLKVYAFIDSQNLNLGTSKNIYNKQGKLSYKGWKLDFKKFRVYLSNKFRVSSAFLFIGKIKENELLYRRLKSYGYEIMTRLTQFHNYSSSDYRCHIGRIEKLK